MRRAIALVLALVQAAAFAQALAPARDAPLSPTPVPPAADFVQHPGAALPLATAFVDSQGRAVPLREALAPGAPTLLMLGWHRCPQLCGLATQGVLEAWRRSGLADSATRVLFVSVDPAETAADAADRERADRGYARLLAGADASAAPAVERLVGSDAGIRALADSVGFRWTPGDARARLAHPAGVVVVTPDGHVSRYLMGVRFDPADLREAVDAAAGNRIGMMSDRLALLCAHLDIRNGARSDAVLAGLRLAGCAILAALAAFAWRHRRPR
jgi:protein SCO1/2